MKYWREVIFCVFIGLLSSVWLWADIIVSNTVSPGDVSNTHPVVRMNEAKGGFHQYPYSSALRTIPEQRREVGMFVYCADSNRIYQLYQSPGHYWRVYANDVSHKLDVARFLGYSTGGRFNPARFTRLSSNYAAWISGKLDRSEFDAYKQQVLSSVTGPAGRDGCTPRLGEDYICNGQVIPGYYDGLNGKDGVTCYILQGSRSVIYNSDGALPSPDSLGTYMSHMYRGADEIEVTYWDWTVPAINTHFTPPPAEIDGMQYRHQYFQPGLASYFSYTSPNNQINVLLTHSSTTIPFGKTTCRTSVTVDFTRIGAQGVQGIPGDINQIARSGLVNKLAEPGSGMDLQPLTADSTQSMLNFRDYTGKIRQYTTPWGYTYYRMPDGTTTVLIQSNGAIYVRRNGVTRVALANDAVSVYRGNGNLAFSIASTAFTGPEGMPTTDGLCKKYNKNGSVYYESCGTGSSSAAVSRYLAYSTYHTVGARFGNYTSTKTINGRSLKSTEVSGTPGFTFEVLFKNVVDFNKVEMMEQYSGNVAHNVDIQIYNYLSSSWQTLETITTQTGLMQKVYSVLNSTPYLSGSNARLRFNHTSAGTSSHYMLLDYVSLTKDTGAGMPQGADKSFQIIRNGAFSGTPFLQYTSVSATQGRIILPAGTPSFQIVNYARRLIFSIRSSGSVVIGG